MKTDLAGSALGLDFGTTNSVAAIAGTNALTTLTYSIPCAGADAVFRLRCASGMMTTSAAGWLRSRPLGNFRISCRVRRMESFPVVQIGRGQCKLRKAPRCSKSVSASRISGQLFLDRFVAHAGGRLDPRPQRAW